MACRNGEEIPLTLSHVSSKIIPTAPQREFSMQPQEDRQNPREGKSLSGTGNLEEAILTLTHSSEDEDLLLTGDQDIWLEASSNLWALSLP